MKEVNPGGGTITLANALVSSGKPILIQVSPTTIFRRYSPDSVNFDEAKSGTLDQIKPGDQLRARGTKSADGSEFTAQAIVSGTFKNIAGTVISTDAANNSITVMDLLTKHPGDPEDHCRFATAQIAALCSSKAGGAVQGRRCGWERKYSERS